jgi:hypothetical protein
MARSGIASLFVLALLTAPAPARAQPDEPMTPLPSEWLASPIHLPCGLTIREWRGKSRPSRAMEAKLERWCVAAERHFVPFLHSRGLELPRPDRGAFRWSESLIPDGDCHRCLNDYNGRFATRFTHELVWGYTSLPLRWSFMISDVRSEMFRQVFTHELFHAMSMYYGLYASHWGMWIVKSGEDEELARAFTRSMGLGAWRPGD